MKAVLRKELRIAFARWELYVFLGLILLSVGVAAGLYHWMSGYAQFQLSLSYALYGLILGVPLLTMGSFTDERRQNTDRLTRSLPIRSHQVLLGKYVALVIPLALATLGLILFALVILLAQGPSIRTALGCIVYFAGIGLVTLALGLHQSALSKTRLEALLTTLLVMLLAQFGPAISTFLLALTSLPLYTLCMAGIVLILAFALTHRPQDSLLIALASAALTLLLFRLGHRALLNTWVSGLFHGISYARHWTSIQNGLFQPAALVYDCSVAALLLLWTGLSLSKGGMTRG